VEGEVRKETEEEEAHHEAITVPAIPDLFPFPSSSRQQKKGYSLNLPLPTNLVFE
jgi:hypothetical protein